MYIVQGMVTEMLEVNALLDINPHHFVGDLNKYPAKVQI